MTISDNLARPGGLSERAQQLLAAGSAYSGNASPMYPDDKQAWARHVREIEDLLRGVLEGNLPPLDTLPLTRSTRYVADVPVYELQPEGAPSGPGSPLYLELHGGALLYGRGDLCELMCAGPALTRPMTTWAIDYRMPPEHPYPAGLEDSLTVYRHAIEDRGPARVVVGGGSAGGNLAAATLLRARDEGLPMPAALVLFTPEVDLTESGDTFRTLDGIDPVLSSLLPANRLYADGHDLADPYLSPLFADLTGFPPTYLQSGTRDLFLSNTVRMHRALRAAGVTAELHVWDAMPHGGFGGAPEDTENLLEARAFIERHLAALANASQ